ncbi:unnamed protein product [Symbiodinium natans]|uniref:Uncharacterized protein n=1 Tax=Symbiodinium natans TaxID=878477 RepID=A0A812HXN8_9DINO|nr:unnamed protein product [Symbiodinium natans]
MQLPVPVAARGVFASAPLPGRETTASPRLTRPLAGLPALFWWALAATAPTARFGGHSRTRGGVRAARRLVHRATQVLGAELRATFEKTAPNWAEGTSHLEAPRELQNRHRSLGA